MDEASMPVSEKPEILRIDLSEAALLLAVHDIRDWEQFSWFEAPSAERLKSAKELLLQLGAVRVREALPEVTELGRKLLNWPLHPRLARIMEASLGLPELVDDASKICAIVSEKDFVFDSARLAGNTNIESDVLLRLELMRDPKGIDLDRGSLANLRRAADQVLEIAKRHKAVASHSNMTLTEILLTGFPDRVCRRRKAGQPEARMVGGKGVKLLPSSCVRKSELFLAIDAVTLAGSAGARGDASVTMASAVTIDALKKLFPERVREVRKTVLDSASGKIMGQVFLAYEDLPLEEPRQTPASESDAAEMIPQLAREMWPELFERNETLKDWFARYVFLKAACPERAWPEFDLRDVSHASVQALIDSVSMGERKPAALLEKDFTWAFNDLIGAELASWGGKKKHQKKVDTRA
jgi:ATP-dependent helicase HrpB